MEEEISKISDVLLSNTTKGHMDKDKITSKYEEMKIEFIRIVNMVSKVIINPLQRLMTIWSLENNKY